MYYTTDETGEMSNSATMVSLALFYDVTILYPGRSKHSRRHKITRGRNLEHCCCFYF